MTSIFLHGLGSWATIEPSKRRAIIDKRAELTLLHEGVASPVFDDRLVDATSGAGATSRNQTRGRIEPADTAAYLSAPISGKLADSSVAGAFP
jgi:hypothetical protein